MLGDCISSASVAACLASLGESLDMGDEEDSSGARGTKLQVARGILAWRVQARSLRRRNAHRFPKIGAACAMGYVDVFGCHLGNELLRSCLAETRMFTSMTNDAFFGGGLHYHTKALTRGVRRIGSGALRRLIVPGGKPLGSLTILTNRGPTCP